MHHREVRPFLKNYEFKHRHRKGEKLPTAGSFTLGICCRLLLFSAHHYCALIGARIRFRASHGCRSKSYFELAPPRSRLLLFTGPWEPHVWFYVAAVEYSVGAYLLDFFLLQPGVEQYGIAANVQRLLVRNGRRCRDSGSAVSHWVSDGNISFSDEGFYMEHLLPCADCMDDARSIRSPSGR